MRELTKSGIINCTNLNEAEHVIFGVPYDITSSGLKGADKGPAAIKEALECQIEPYSRVSGITLDKLPKIAWRDLGNLSKLTPGQMVAIISRTLGRYLKASKAVTVIGGDHSVTIPALKAFSLASNPLETTILHIDAHLDLRDIDEFRAKPFGKFAHCCVMRRAWDFGFRHFVQVGARAYGLEEIEFARRNWFRIFGAGYRMEKPDQIALAINKTYKVWISLDVDGICPGDMPATGTPVGGGPSLDYVNELLYEVSRFHEIVGVDIVEVAPPLGATDLTAYNAAQIVYDTIAMRVARKLDLQRR